LDHGFKLQAHLRRSSGTRSVSAVQRQANPYLLNRDDVVMKCAGTRWRICILWFPVLLLAAATRPDESAGQASPWVFLSSPTEWAVLMSPGSQEPPALQVQLHQRIRIQGEAYHPAGIFEVLVGNARVELQHGADGTHADFVTFLTLTVPQRTITIQVRGYAGQPFEAVYPLVYEADEDLTKFAQPWAAPDSIQLLIGTNDTVAIRLAAPPHDRVPARHLIWSTSNSDVVTVDTAGVVHPVAQGSAAIYVSGLGQNITFAVRVYDQPSDITFLPADTVIDLVLGQSLRTRANLHMPSGQLVRNLVPELAGPDTIVLKRESIGSFLAVRTGSTVIRATLGTRTHRWLVRVFPPSIQIVNTYGALLIGQPQSLRAVRRARDGTVLGPAEGVSWQVSDTGKVSIRGATALGQRPGRAGIAAANTTEADTSTFFVLGELLIAAKDERGDDMLATVSLHDRQTHRIGADSVRGTSLSLSPDGRQIAFAGRVASRSPRIYVMDADGLNLRRLVPDGGGLRGSYEEHSPRWSHDGNRIVFVSNRLGNYEILSVRTDGSDPQRLTNNSASDWRVSTAPDVPRIAFERIVGAGDGDIVVTLADGSGEAIYTLPRPLPEARISETKPALLPGATALVFARGAPRLDAAAGQTLSLLDLTTGLATRDLVAPVRDTELVFAVSPDGQRIAYHLRAFGRKNNIITIIDLTGNVVGSISVSRVREILEISWGAIPPTSRENGS
jgi:hypothetical protein